MSDQSSATHEGFIHQACLYQSDDEVLSVLVPFLRDARGHGEATVVDLDARKSDLLRRELGAHADEVEFVGGSWYTNPASAIREFRRCFESLLEDDEVRAVRAVGEIPPAALNGSWHAWRRYEAAINLAFDGLPVWGVCLYDRTAVPPEVLSDVLCTHPHLATAPAARDANELYTDPRDFLLQLPPPPQYEIERTTPDLQLVDAAPHEARAAVAPLADGLSTDDRGGLISGVSEITANAMAHGEPPVILRAWRGAGYVVVTVDDSGPGIQDPFAGLLAPTREMGAGGLGLWITNQLCSDVAVMDTAEGFRVRLVVGDVHDHPGGSASSNSSR